MGRKKKTHDTLRTEDGLAALCEITEGLRRRRIAMKLRQTDVAASCGCSLTAYSNFERGNPSSSLILLGAIRKLGLSAALMELVNKNNDVVSILNSRVRLGNFK